MSIRNKHLVMSVSLLAVLGIASAAWACTSQPRFLAVSSMRGPRAEPVNITGEGVMAEKAITIRWNTLNGPKLAEVVPSESGSFSASVVIPDVAPGVYSILIESDSGVGRTAFEVIPEQSALPNSRLSAEPVRTDLWQGFNPLNDALSGAAAASDARAGQPWSAAMAAGAFFAAAGLLGLTILTGVALRRRQGSRAGSR